MRNVKVSAPQGTRDAIVQAAGEHGAMQTLSSSAHADGRAVDVVETLLPNDKLGAFVGAVSKIGDVRVAAAPQGLLLFEPPDSEPSDRAAQVAVRSPLEIVLSSLQSIGSMGSFLAYAATSGAVVFAAFYTNTIFLLVGAMLISPMAEPAMNAAIATARGAGGQIARSVGRYLTGLATGAVVAAALTLLYGPEEPTTLMVDVSSSSPVAVLLPLAAGVAGAVNLVSAERSSLVSGAGPGLLIAASLAPPMGLVGMGLVLGEGGLLSTAAFLLVLQLFGINLAAALTFRLAGVRSDGMRWERGRPGTARAAAVLSLAAVAGLVALQLAGSPNLRREGLERRAETAARRAIDATPGAHTVRVEAAYAREDIDGRRTLTVSGFALNSGDEPPADVEDELARRVSAEVEEALPDTTVLVDLVVAGP